MRLLIQKIEEDVLDNNDNVVFEEETCLDDKTLDLFESVANYNAHVINELFGGVF